MKLTDDALTKLQERRAQSETWGIRLSIKGGGCGGYTYELCYEEMPSITDMIYERIVAVDSYSDSYLQDATLAWQVNGVQEEFVIQNEELETGRCGCGESFYMEKI